MRRVRLGLFAAGLATFALLYTPQPLLPQLAGAFHASPAAASLAMSAGTGALALAIIPVSSLSEVLGRRAVMTSSVLAAAVLGLLAPLAPSPARARRGPRARGVRARRGARRRDGLPRGRGRRERPRPCHGPVHRGQRHRRARRAGHRGGPRGARRLAGRARRGRRAGAGLRGRVRRAAAAAAVLHARHAAAARPVQDAGSQPRRHRAAAAVPDRVRADGRLRDRVQLPDVPAERGAVRPVGERHRGAVHRLPRGDVVLHGGRTARGPGRAAGGTRGGRACGHRRAWR